MEYILEQVADRSPTNCSEVAERSPISRRPIADQSPTSFSDNHAPILTKLVGDRLATRRLVGDWSGTGRRLCWDLSATKSVAARFLCKHKNLSATDLVATRPPISRRLLCNLAGTDRGPCCDLCDLCKLSVAERSQSGCNVCLTGVLCNDNFKPKSDIHCNRSATSPRPKFITIAEVAEESQLGFTVGRRLVGDWSGTGCRLIGDWSATSWGPLCDLMQLVADRSGTGPRLIADQSPISRRPNKL